MADQRIFNPLASRFNPHLQDPVFEPSPDFNFEDPHNGMYGGQGDLQLYGGHMHSGFPGQDQGSVGLSGDFWSNAFDQGLGGVPDLPPSNQGDIVNNRAGSVAQHFGQITPPETGAEEKAQQAQESDAAKRKERARNAANKRHAKTKKARTESESIHEDDEGTEARGERQAHYREKNRVAAAKCRAKKKDHNDNLEEIHREEASKNKILKAELMGLRNELAQLKGLTLEHSPDSCQCHGIHEYSMRQANLIARGAAPQYRASVSSLSQGSPLSAETPVSMASNEGFFSMHDPMMSPPLGDMARKSSSSSGAPGDRMQLQ